MRQFLGRLFDLACALSLLLFIAAFSFWVRSSEVQDSFDRSAQDSKINISVSLGVIRFSYHPANGYARPLPPNLVPTRYRHEARPPRIFKEPTWVGEQVTFERFGFVVWNWSPAPTVPKTCGVNLPCWAPTVLFSLLPLCWFLSFRHERSQARQRGFEVSVDKPVEARH